MINANKLRGKMAEQRVTAVELAVLIGVSNNTVSRYLNGITVPDIERAKAIKDTLGLTDADFMEIFLPDPSQIRNVRRDKKCRKQSN